MINGLISVYKDKGFTSFDVVAVMRGISGQRKIGHTGTLDPDATGVLPICLGNATKLCDMLTDKTKEYVATFMFGIKTDTLDNTGTVIGTKQVKTTEDEVIKAVNSFVGGYEQIPPMFSAKQVDGKRLYDLARQGKSVERKPVFVRIDSISVEKIELPYVTIRVSCGKGTYIRSLCEDIAGKCGEYAVMTSLERTRVMCFTRENSYTLSELTALKEEGRLDEAVTKTDVMFYEYPDFHVKPDFRKLIDNGNALRLNMVTGPVKLSDGDIVRIYNDSGAFVGLYEYAKERGFIKPYKMFMEES